MKTDWLEAFAIFGETLNFTHAAERLFISQPALHVKIQKLSDHVGHRLYQKTGRNLSLTREGQLLHQFAQRQLREHERLLEELTSESKAQPVRLIAGEGTYLYLLGHVIEQFLSDQSRSLEVLTGNQDDVITAIRSGDADLGVTTLSSVPDGIQADLFTRSGQMLVMPEDHHLARKKQIELIDLEGARLIVPPKGRPHRLLIDRMMMDSDVHWHPVMEVKRWDLILKFVRHGLGMAIVNDYCDLPQGLRSFHLPTFPKLNFYTIRRQEDDLRVEAQCLNDLLALHGKSISV